MGRLTNTQTTRGHGQKRDTYSYLVETADVGADSKACLPPCRNDGDCLGPGRPYCSPWTERCTDDPDVTPSSPGGSADEGGFCRSSGRSRTWPAALLRR